jgi:exopolysaccharide biosynthesis polyprenyl glycosylphosphotransferase
MAPQQVQTEPPSEPAHVAAAPPARRVVRLRNPFARARSQRDLVRGRFSETTLGEGHMSAANYRRDAIYRRSLALADVAAAVIAVPVGVQLLGHQAPNPVVLLALPLVILVSKVTGLYERDEHVVRKTTLDEVPALFWVATLYAFLIWFAGDLIVSGQFGRGTALAVWVLLFAGMFTTRTVARYFARRASVVEHCLVVGDAETAAWIRRRFDDAPGVNARVIGRMPLEPEAASPNGLPVFADVEALAPLIGSEQVDRAIIAPGTAVSDDLLNTIRRLKSLGIKVSVLPRLFEVVGSSVELDDVDGITLLGMHRYGLSRSSGIVKRGLDIVGATLGLLLLSPLLVTIAVAIKLDSRGPVLFRQRRMGRNEVPFEMLKFRTMVDGADAQKAALQERNEAGGGLFKIEDDPRITRVGRVLRRASLDELPQLINVFRGDMALVGPRPLVLDEDSQIEGWRRSRLQLPPGMTGPWQVFGSARIPLHEMVKIDYLYGANWSMWQDVKILFRTVPFVLGRRGL